MKVVLLLMIVAITSGLRAGARGRRPSAVVMLGATALTVTMLYSAKWI